MTYKVAIHWFRNDLRLRDNPSLAHAHTVSEEVLHLYVIDKRWDLTAEPGIPRIGDWRKRFILEGVHVLKHDLESRGNTLVIEKGEPYEVISKWVSLTGATLVTAQKEHTFEEVEQEDLVREINDILLQTEECISMVHPDDLPFHVKDTPSGFSRFRKIVEKNMGVRQPLDEPQGIKPAPPGIGNQPGSGIDPGAFPEPDARAAIRWVGGEAEAWQYIREYIWEQRHITHYKETRNGLLGKDFSSKCSAWLSVGNLSARQLFHEIRLFEQEIIRNASTYWLVFELLWRDYFRFTAMKEGNVIFCGSGNSGNELTGRKDKDLFMKWATGRTGNEFVDANMNELRQTGFMSNRGRQNVASFLIHDLGVDWRWGAAWMEAWLTDYDVCSNYGNWRYIAGLTDRSERHFDTADQAARYDPDRRYRKTWLPEQ
jgi:deoxyribodipyrimidine photo-lyase